MSSTPVKTLNVNYVRFKVKVLRQLKLKTKLKQLSKGDHNLVWPQNLNPQITEAEFPPRGFRGFGRTIERNNSTDGGIHQQYKTIHINIVQKGNYPDKIEEFLKKLVERFQEMEHLNIQPLFLLRSEHTLLPPQKKFFIMAKEKDCEDDSLSSGNEADMQSDASLYSAGYQDLSNTICDLKNDTLTKKEFKEAFNALNAKIEQKLIQEQGTSWVKQWIEKTFPGLTSKPALADAISDHCTEEVLDDLDKLLAKLKSYAGLNLGTPINLTKLINNDVIREDQFTSLFDALNHPSRKLGKLDNFLLLKKYDVENLSDLTPELISYIVDEIENMDSNLKPKFLKLKSHLEKMKSEAEKE